jgi:hypothetical protein
MTDTGDADQVHDQEAASTGLLYGRESFNRVVAPVLAGFSLPAIFTLATSDIPGQPWRDITLSFMAIATGLFLAGYQLTIGSLYTHFHDSWGKARAAISFSGMAFLVAALIVVIAAAVHRWWVVFPLLVLFLGGIIPLGVRGWLVINR